MMNRPSTTLDIPQEYGGRKATELTSRAAVTPLCAATLSNEIGVPMDEDVESPCTCHRYSIGWISGSEPRHNV